MAIGRERLKQLKKELDLSPKGIRLQLIRAVADSLFGKAPKARMMRFGMFKGPHMSTEEDFKIAEWNPDSNQKDG